MNLRVLELPNMAQHNSEMKQLIEKRDYHKRTMMIAGNGSTYRIHNEEQLRLNAQIYSLYCHLKLKQTVPENVYDCGSD